MDFLHAQITPRKRVQEPDPFGSGGQERIVKYFYATLQKNLSLPIPQENSGLGHRNLNQIQDLSSSKLRKASKLSMHSFPISAFLLLLLMAMKAFLPSILIDDDV